MGQLGFFDAEQRLVGPSGDLTTDAQVAVRMFLAVSASRAQAAARSAEVVPHAPRLHEESKKR
jgi:hypothetical protein